MKIEKKKLAKFFFDLFRFCIIFGLVVPAITIPLVKPILRFFDASDEILNQGFYYLTSLLCGNIVVCFLHLFCGCLQSENKMLIYGVVQCSVFLLNMLVFDPIFLLGFHIGLAGAGIATICSEFIPMVVLAFFFFSGRMTTKIQWESLISKFDKETWQALKIGITQFLSRIFFNIPSFFSRKYVSSAAESNNEYELVLAAWNVTLRVWSIPASYANAVSIAFLPAASFSFGAKDFKNVLSLMWWAQILAFIWCSLMELVLIFARAQISGIFFDDLQVIERSNTFLFITYVLAALMGVQFITPSFMQATKKATLAICLTFLIQFVPVPLFGSILYFTDSTKNVNRLMYMYPLNDVFAFVVCVGFIIYQVIQFKKTNLGFQVIQEDQAETVDETQDETQSEGNSLL